MTSARTFDLVTNGKRIVALMPATEAEGSQEAQNHVVFLENFFDELRRKVPAGEITSCANDGADSPQVAHW